MQKIINIIDSNVHTASASYIVSIINNSTTTQAISVAIYDSIGNISGTPIITINTGLGAYQIITYPSPGLPLSFGLTAQASGNPSANGIQILYTTTEQETFLELNSQQVISFANGKSFFNQTVSVVSPIVLIDITTALNYLYTLGWSLISSNTIGSFIFYELSLEN
jgi:hypothetical protein